MLYHTIAFAESVSFSVSDIEIMRSESKDRYDISVKVSVNSPDDSSDSVVVEGRAYLENGKIYSFTFDEHGEVDKLNIKS